MIALIDVLTVVAVVAVTVHLQVEVDIVIITVNTVAIRVKAIIVDIIHHLDLDHLMKAHLPPDLVLEEDQILQIQVIDIIIVVLLIILEAIQKIIVILHHQNHPLPQKKKLQQ